MHENEHCRAGVSKTKSKIRTSAEANEGLQLKSDFVIPKGMTVFFWGGVSSRTGSQQTKASAARIAPILIPKGWKNAAAYPMRCGTKPRSTLLRQASAGGDFGPRGDKRRNGFPNDGVSRLDPAVRKKSGSIPAPRRIPRWTAAPTLCSAAPDRAAEAAAFEFTRPSGKKSPDRNYRLPHLVALRARRQRPPSAPPHRIVRRRRRTSTRQLRIAGTVWEEQRHRRT